MPIDDSLKAEENLQCHLSLHNDSNNHLNAYHRSSQILYDSELSKSMVSLHVSHTAINIFYSIVICNFVIGIHEVL